MIMDVNKLKNKVEKKLEERKLKNITDTVGDLLVRLEETRNKQNSKQHDELITKLVELQEVVVNSNEQDLMINAYDKNTKTLADYLSRMVESLDSGSNLQHEQLQAVLDALELVTKTLGRQIRTTTSVKKATIANGTVLGNIYDAITNKLDLSFLKGIGSLLEDIRDRIESFWDPETKSLNVTVTNPTPSVKTTGGRGIIPFRRSDNTITKALLDDQDRLEVNASGATVSVNNNTTATGVTMFNVDVVNSNTEYNQALPSGVKRITLQSRDDENIRFAYESGKVAGPSSPYFTLKAGQVYYEDGLIDLAGATLSVASGVSNITVEIIAWQ